MSSASSLYDRAFEAAQAIRALVPEPPKTAVVLGSGLGSLVERYSERVTIPYAQIPNFPRPTVVGHAGNLVLVTSPSTQAIFMQGRFHYYEGHDLEAVTFPIRVFQILGVKSLILTAATGGIRQALKPGMIVCLSDHINLIGANPLRGPHDERLGARFPDMTTVYCSKLQSLAHHEAHQLHITLSAGVYACLPGPSYETPSEIRMLRGLGADVVGMSTVPEAIVARHAGMDVLAFALVTNAAAGLSESHINHEEVLAAGRNATPVLGTLIDRVVRRLSA